MKKTITLILLIPHFIFSQVTIIPDSNFEQALINLGLDNVNDGQVTTSNIDNVTILNLAFNSISDLTGIEDFSALTELHCSFNELTSLDLSNNTTLVELFCHDNHITSLDLSNNTALVYLGCGNNQLTTLDINNNNLKWLDCSENSITNLDISNNTDLIDLYCYNNQIYDLNLSNNLDLYSLDCHNNQLTSLNITNNYNLNSLDCRNNLINCLNTKNGNSSNIIVRATSNNLICVEVDNIGFATTNWQEFDNGVIFNTNCNYTNCSWASINENIFNISLYPNPTNKFLKFELNYPNQLIYELTIFDNLGRKIFMSNIIINDEIEIDVRDFKNGIYHYTLLCPTQNLRSTGKFIKN